MFSFFYFVCESLFSKDLKEIHKNLHKNIKISPLAYVIKACAEVIKDFERINSSLSEDGKQIIIKKYINIDTDKDALFTKTIYVYMYKLVCIHIYTPCN